MLWYCHDLGTFCVRPCRINELVKPLQSYLPQESRRESRAGHIVGLFLVRLGYAGCETLRTDIMLKQYPKNR